MFDLDGTLTESKQPLSNEMATLLARLLAQTKVGVISGGALPQFLKQVVAQLPPDANLSNLYLLPVSGASLYARENGEWKKVYEERLSETDVARIEEKMQMVATETGIIDFNAKSYDKRIENRGAQVSMSALGQKAPAELKKEWDPDKSKRRVLQAALQTELPGFLVAMGGMTTIDVTKKGIDKAYGVRKLCDYVGLAESDVLYVGDQLVAGGNDEAVFKTNAQVHAVASLADTERVIVSLLP